MGTPIYGVGHATCIFNASVTLVCHPVMKLLLALTLLSTRSVTALRDPPPPTNFSFVGSGRCTQHDALSYITGAYNALKPRHVCASECAKRPACIAYWFYTEKEALFSSCFLDGRSANDTASLVSDLGEGWEFDGKGKDNYCQDACTVGATDGNRLGGEAECYKRD